MCKNAVDTQMAEEMPDHLWAIFCKPHGARLLKEYLAGQKSGRSIRVGAKTANIVL